MRVKLKQMRWVLPQVSLFAFITSFDKDRAAFIKINFAPLPSCYLLLNYYGCYCNLFRISCVVVLRQQHLNRLIGKENMSTFEPVDRCSFRTARFNCYDGFSMMLKIRLISWTHEHSTECVWRVGLCSLYYVRVKASWPIRVALRSKSWTVFVLSNTGIMGSNLTWGMDICVR
jgi:hypothetical protein